MPVFVELLQMEFVDINSLSSHESIVGHNIANFLLQFMQCTLFSQADKDEHIRRSSKYYEISAM